MEIIKSLFDKKINLKANNYYIYIILIIGIALLVFSSFVGNKKGTKVPDNISISPAYTEKQLEVKLEEILSSVKGAGKVSVMITYNSTSTKIVASDKKSNSTVKKEGIDSNTKTEEVSTNENKTILVGGVPYVIRQDYPSIKGVIVTATGGGNSVIKQDLAQAVMSVLDVPIHKIVVLEKKL